MSLSELLKKVIVRKTEPDKGLCAKLLALSRSDIKAAEDSLASGNFGWALAIAYHSMLSAGRALMASMGYRPSFDAHHLAVVRFCAEVFPVESAQLASTFNRYRVRRHDAVYGEAESVGQGEAKNAIKNARLFLQKVEEQAK
jgi:uncharacterized protein (UPF0332 family)